MNQTLGELYQTRILDHPNECDISSVVNHPDWTSCSFEFLRSKVFVTVLMNISWWIKHATT